MTRSQNQVITRHIYVSETLLEHTELKQTAKIKELYC